MPWKGSKETYLNDHAVFLQEIPQRSSAQFGEDPLEVEQSRRLELGEELRVQEVEGKLIDLAQVVGAVRAVVLRLLGLQKVRLGGHQSVGA